MPALRSGRRNAVVALLGLALAACGGSDTVKPAELVDFKPLAKARVAWRASVGEAKPFVFTPALYEGSIYAASRGGQLVRLDAANGKPIWRVDTKEKLSGGVGADAGLVLVGSLKGVVLAYSTDGKPLWRAQVTSEVLGAPRAAEGIVVVRSADGRFFGLDAASGARKWEYQVTLPPLVLRAHPSVTIVRKLVLAGLPAGRMIALDLASGTPVWEALVAQPKGDNELERITDIAAAPVVVEGDQACAVAYQGRVACVDIGKGALAWGGTPRPPGAWASTRSPCSSPRPTAPFSPSTRDREPPCGSRTSCSTGASPVRRWRAGSWRWATTRATCTCSTRRTAPSQRASGPTAAPSARNRCAPATMWWCRRARAACSRSRSNDDRKGVTGRRDRREA
jgi:hypothetical protein